MDRGTRPIAQRDGPEIWTEKLVLSSLKSTWKDWKTVQREVISPYSTPFHHKTWGEVDDLNFFFFGKTNQNRKLLVTNTKLLDGLTF
jgi:hypothetical protein